MKKFFVFGALAIIVIVAAYALLRHPATVPKLPIKTLDPWILQSNDPKAIDGTEPESYAIYLGNGYIGTRIGANGVGKGPCYMSGLYRDEKLIALPNWSDFPLYDSDGKRFVLDETAPYRQTLNMREGYVETELTLKSGRQRLVGKVTFFIARPKVSIVRYLPVNIASIRYELTPTRDGIVQVRNELKVPAGWSKTDIKQTSDGAIVFVGFTNYYSGISAAVFQTGATVFSVVTDRLGTVKKGDLRVINGSSMVLTKYVGVNNWPDADIHGTEKRQNAQAAALRRAGFDKLLDASKKAWHDLWKSDIVIDGDPAAQQAVHAMMFSMLSSASPDWSIPPTGLSSGAWQGQIFWDADTWMFPALFLQHPDLASGIVDYRLNTIQGARENAKKRGLPGAEFGWQSGGTGREAIARPYSEERHITADVAIAADTWARFAKDISDYDHNGVNRLLEDTAAYWAARVTYNKAKDRYEILNIVPPDEDAEIVNNSVYTNAAAKRNIELAIAAAKKAGRNYPAKWDEIVSKMYIPFDAKNKRFIEYEGYNGKKTKQADTELLIYPLMYPMSDEVKQSTFDYYKTKTDPRGPAMTSSIHSIIAAELARPDEAYQHFLESYKDFLRGPFLIFNEKRSKTYENMCFVTGCGGSLQSVLYGFAGLRTGNAPGGFEELLPGLYIKPCLPSKWKKLEIQNIEWAGKSYDLTVLPGNKWQIKKSVK